MSITGRNALTALAVGLIAVLPVLLLVLFARVVFDIADGKDIDVWGLINSVPDGFLGLGMCITPVTFILAFALLQRIRIR